MSSAQEVLDAFKDNGGLPLYLNMNRTATYVDFKVLLVILTFIVAVVSFLIILPGIRKEVGSFCFFLPYTFTFKLRSQL